MLDSWGIGLAVLQAINKSYLSLFPFSEDNLILLTWNIVIVVHYNIRLPPPSCWCGIGVNWVNLLWIRSLLYLWYQYNIYMNHIKNQLPCPSTNRYTNPTLFLLRLFFVNTRVNYSIVLLLATHNNKLFISLMNIEFVIFLGSLLSFGNGNNPRFNTFSRWPDTHR